jgi:cholesterol oxidase
MPADPLVAFQFTEEMKGYVTHDQTTFKDGYRKGEDSGTSLMFHLTIRMEDLDLFLAKPEHQAKATGYVESPLLGGRCKVEEGWFNLFVDTADNARKRMVYRLYLRDHAGNDLTLSGFKDIQDKAGFDVWTDTTTLFTNLFKGRIKQKDEAKLVPWAVGILRISLSDFTKQMKTIRVFAPTRAGRVDAVVRFTRFFLGSLWDTYANLPSFRIKPYEREIPLYTTEGVPDAEITSHPFITDDRLGLSLTRFQRAPDDDVVLIIHGLTTSSDMFIMPEHYNLVRYLLDNGFRDVWTLDDRLSNRFPYNLRRSRFNMDDVALFDFPAAIAALRARIGPDRRIHVIAHCLGSIGFMMSLFGKQVSGITSVISNSVSLTPCVPRWSNIKLMLAPVLCEYVAGLEYANPCWRREPGFSVGKILGTVVSGFHHECDVPECHMLSFMWGTGFPALYRHENMHDVTHRRVGDLFGGVSFHYFRHILKMVRARNTAVKFDEADPRYSVLPNNYLQHAADIRTPVLFMTGQDNRVFTNSNIVTFDRLQKIVPGRHELHVFPNYGHQDVFQGKNSHVDVFPRLLQFLNTHRGRPALQAAPQGALLGELQKPPQGAFQEG